MQLEKKISGVNDKKLPQKGLEKQERVRTFMV